MRLFNLFWKWLMAKKIDRREHRDHRERLFSSVFLWVLCGFPNLIPEDNKKVSETSSNQIKYP